MATNLSQAIAPQGLRGVHQHHPVECLRVGGLEQQRNVVHDYERAGFARGSRQVRLARAHGGMDDPLEIAARGGVVEDKGAKQHAVE